MASGSARCDLSGFRDSLYRGYMDGVLARKRRVFPVFSRCAALTCRFEVSWSVYTSEGLRDALASRYRSHGDCRVRGIALDTHRPDDPVLEALRLLPESVRVPLVMRRMAQAPDREIAEALILGPDDVAHRIEEGAALLNAHLRRLGVPASTMDVLIDRCLTPPPADRVVGNVMAAVRRLPAHGSPPPAPALAESLTYALGALAVTAGVICGIGWVVDLLGGS
jgi:hypothetical protein